MFFKNLKIIFYELLPFLLIKKVNYRLEGYCNKCGDCCRYIICNQPFALMDYKLMAFLFPKYKRFKIIGKDEWGNLILACNLIKEDGVCPDYKNRLALCKSYPCSGVSYSGGNLYKRCSYKLIPEKNFYSYLKRSN